MTYKRPTSPEMQAKIRDAAKRLGFTARHGKYVGEGNPSEFIQAFDSGQVTLLRIKPEDAERLAFWLEKHASYNPTHSLYYTWIALATQLRESVERNKHGH